MQVKTEGFLSTVSRAFKTFKFLYFISSSTSFPLIDKPINPISFVLPNQITLSELLKQRLTSSQLKQIHAQIIAQALSSLLVTSLVCSYASVNNLTYARLLFDRYPLPSPPTLLWNLMIQAYSKRSDSLESLHLFHRMLVVRRSSSIPDKYTYTFVITACSRLPVLIGYGKSIHGLVLKNGFEYNTFVGNSLVSMYATLDKMANAQRVFNEMPQRDVVTWTSLVRGYTKRGELVMARKLFCEMPERNDVSWAVLIAGFVEMEKYNDALQHFNYMLHEDKVKPNEAVLVCVLSACAHLGALEQGKWIHVYIDKSGVSESSNISTALIDMYAKCGSIDCASRVFNGIPKRDVFAWTSMLSGLSLHGLGKEAIQMFSQILAENIRPDDITLLGVLNACSHSGLVEDGCSIFDNMEREWGIVPKIEHYGCLIDLLGRAGKLSRAFEVVKSMPIEPDAVVWRALLSACRIHGDVGLGEQVIDYISQLDPDSHGGGYVLLSNLYATKGRWDKVSVVRNMMNERGVGSSTGCSWIEVDGIVHEFLAADRLHPRIVEIHSKLNEMLRRTSTEGCYVPNTNQVLGT